jgi:sigma-B regulation protein RsbU (phosphoserine phosphatase)
MVFPRENDQPALWSILMNDENATRQGIGGKSRMRRMLSVNSVRTKFLAFVVPLVMLSTVLVFGWSEYNARRGAELKLEDKLEKLVAIQSAVIAQSLWNVDDSQIKLILAALAIDPDVIGVTVHDEQGKLVGSIGTVKEIDKLQFFAKKTVVFKNRGKLAVIGSLSIALTDASLKLAARERLLLAIELATVLLICVVISALVGNRRTIGIPLERLLKSINRSRQGHERSPVIWHSNDEIGEVVSSFNEMQERQQAYEEELEEARDNLEHRVEERTKDLEEKEAQLRIALDNMPGGLAVNDNNGIYSVVNSWIREFLSVPEGIMEPGKPAKELLRHLAERGIYGPGDVEQLVQERVAALTKDGKTSIDELVTEDGRYLQVQRQPLSGGGAAAIFTDITERKKAEAALEEAYEIIRGQNERMETELNVAHEIQMSMVPLTFPAFPDYDEFTVFADLQPAREVGGDFYDFFFIDEERFCVCIGDVSGKGVPAALFMAVSKTLIKSRATDDFSTASILTHVNDELSANNNENMFVTLFIAVVNIVSGDFVFTNAGHNPPFIRRNNGALQCLNERHGPVVGAMEGMVYGEDRSKLDPAEILLLYTDGVTEAMDAENNMYSDQRLLKLLETMEADSVETVVNEIVTSVETFEDGVVQTDDITVLAFQFHGRSEASTKAVLHISIKNELMEIGRMSEEFEAFADRQGIPLPITMKLNIVFDELLSNIISYAYRDEDEHEISAHIELVTDRLIVTISDDGVPFNPLNAKPPDTQASIEDRDFGGLGIHLVRNLVDEISYHRRIGRNVLTLVKNLGSKDV